MCVCVQSCRLFCDHVDYIPTGSSVHGISQARILERVAIAYSRGSPWPKAQTHVCLTSIFFTKATREKPLVYVIGLLKLLNLRHQAFYVFHLLSVIHFLPSYHHFPTPKALFHFFCYFYQDSNDTLLCPRSKILGMIKIKALLPRRNWHLSSAYWLSN